MTELHMRYAVRNGEWLELDAGGIIADAALHHVKRELAAPQAGSHPHHLRQWLLASSLFPEKWINRLFSIGGIGWRGGKIGLLAFPATDSVKDSLYRMAADKSLSVAYALPPILYEDDYCLVLNKPAGMPVHASFKGERGTLDEMAARHLLESGDPLPVRHIHRLDDDTSGPVLYAKNDLAQLRLDEAMRVKEIDRRYIAIVQGVMKRSAGVIDAPIGKDRHHSARRLVSPSGDSAITHYEVAGRSDQVTLVRVRLETGRTHQIRVHMSDIGHPLAGDILYGGSSRLLSHQALHGERLMFPHPLTGQRVDVAAPWPQWISRIMKDMP